MFEKVAALAKAILGKIKALFEKTTEMNYRFFKDMQKAENILSSVMNRYAARQGKSRSEVFGKEIKKASTVLDKLKNAKEEYADIEKKYWDDHYVKERSAHGNFDLESFEMSIRSSMHIIGANMLETLMNADGGGYGRHFSP